MIKGTILEQYRELGTIKEITEVFSLYSEIAEVVNSLGGLVKFKGAVNNCSCGAFNCKIEERSDGY